MVEIREYNLATGHVETLATVSTEYGAAVRDALDDHGTDHVTYLCNCEES